LIGSPESRAALTIIQYARDKDIMKIEDRKISQGTQEAKRQWCDFPVRNVPVCSHASSVGNRHGAPGVAPGVLETAEVAEDAEVQ
jgi:hypothetical protein